MSLNEISIAELYEKLIKFLQKYIYLLAKNIGCSKCNLKMGRVRKLKLSHGFVFPCSKCKNEVSMRKGTIFSKSKLSLKEL